MTNLLLNVYKQFFTKKTSLFVLFICLFLNNYAATYYWVGGTGPSSGFQDRSLWSTVGVGGTPVGTSGTNITFTTADILIIDGSDVSSAAGIQTGNISAPHGNSSTINCGQFIVQNSANISIGTGGSSNRTINIGNGISGDDLIVTTGSYLNFQEGGSSGYTVNLVATNTGLIDGTIVIGVPTPTSSGTSTLTINTAGTFTVNGTWIHSSTGAISTPLDRAVFGADATVVFRGSSSCNSSVAISGKTLPNVTIESTSGTWTPTITGGTPTTITGNLNIGGTGSGIVNTGTGYTSVLTINKNVSIKASCTLALGGDYVVKGDWTNNGTFTHATGKTVTFNGTSTQTVTKSGGENFKALTISNTSASVILANGATVTNATTVDANAKLETAATLTATGGATINGTFQINQGGYATGTFSYAATGSTLAWNNSSGLYGSISTHTYFPSSNSPYNVSVLGAGGVDFGNIARTINGTFTVAAYIQEYCSLTLNGTIMLNAGYNFGTACGTGPTYDCNSTLTYNSGGSPALGNEWRTTCTPGNVTIANNTSLSISAASRTVHYTACGNLNISSGSTLNLTLQDGSGPYDQKGLIIGKDINNAGTITMSSDSHQAISCINFTNTGTATFSSNANGGDLYITGNFTNNGSSTSAVNFNGRALICTGSSNQTIGGSVGSTGTGATPFAIDYLIISKTGGIVTVQKDIYCDGEGTNNGGSNSGGGSITVDGNSNPTATILDISGIVATVSKTGDTNYYSTITCLNNGFIRTSASTTLNVYGDHHTNTGTLSFDQTTPNTTNVIGTLNLNRSGSGYLNFSNDFVVTNKLQIAQGTLYGGSTASIVLDSVAVGTLSSTLSSGLNLKNLIFTRTASASSEFYKNTGTLTVNGIVRTKLHFARLGKWHFVSFPYAASLKKSDGTTSATIGTGSSDGDCGVYWYDPAKRATNVSGWTQHTSSLSSGVGYIIAKRGTLEDLYFDSGITGTVTDPMFGSTHSSTLTYTVADITCNAGWNFIAFPLSASATPALTDGEFAYSYNPSNDTYKLWYHDYNAGYTYGSSSMKPFTSYFVKTASASSVNLSITGYSTPMGILKKISSQNQSSDEIIPINLNVNSRKYETLMRVKSESTLGQDELYDAPYNTPMSSSTPRLFTLIEGYQYSLNSVPEGSVVPVGFRVPAEGTYSFTWTPPTSGVQAMLTDNLTSTVTDMTSVSMYEFTVNSADIAKDITTRFVINVPKRVPTGITHEKENTPYKIFITGNSINIDGLNLNTEVSLFDITGKLLSTKSVNSNLTVFNVQCQGIYILQTQEKTGYKYNKIIVN